MHSKSRDKRFALALALFLLPLTALIVALIIKERASSEYLPPSAAARVGKQVIDKQTAKRWVLIAARQQPGAAGAALPDAPGYGRCIAAGRQENKRSKGAPKLSDAQLSEQCAQAYEAIKSQGLQFLLTGQWLRQEAKKRGLNVSDAEVRERFLAKKKESFPSETEYQQFLAQSGMNEQDLLLRVRTDLYSERLRADVVKETQTVSEDDIARIYKQDPQRYAEPEKRDLQIILSSSRRASAAAKQAIKTGQPYGEVVKRYSLKGSNPPRGVLRAQTQEQLNALDPNLGRTVFAAPPQRLIGPVKSQSVYYIVRVTSVQKATPKTLPQARPEITKQIQDERAKKPLAEFAQKWEKKFIAKTICAREWIVPSCSNAPPAPTPPGPPPGSPPGSPQGPPPGS